MGEMTVDTSSAADELVAALTRAQVEVDGSSLGQYLYSTDASLYRVPPAAVAFPRNADDIAACLQVARDLGVPLTARGAGTSIAGNAIGTGLVIDASRHMDRIFEIDEQAKTATVQPGVVQADLQRAAAATGLRFGPDPSTSNRCTIGGMIGNNACGSRALGYGRTSDNIVALDVMTPAGERMQFADPLAPDALPPSLAELAAIADESRELIASNFATFSRQVSGYALENLVAPGGMDLRRLIAGSEGTLALITSATVRLVQDPPVRGLLVLGYPSMPAAADDVMTALAYGPTACEGLDARIVDAVVSRHGPSRVPPLPEGKGWLFVELVGDDANQVESQAGALAREANALDSMFVVDPLHAGQLWRIREDGAGLSGISPAGKPAYAGWEDAAVPPATLGKYLRDFDALMAGHGITGMPYGHFGDGCVHVRLDFPLLDNDGPRRMRAFLGEAADLVVKYGGSLSGEHGDGRARGELLAKMYDEPSRELFRRVKHVFDPDHLLNPGIIVEPRPLDADLRASTQRPLTQPIELRLPHDNGDFSAAVHRCTGVGKCRADTTAAGGVMCPSFLATKNEKDSTRGRARVLQEMLAADASHPDWRSKEVHEALDLCLMCKGCASDCPTGVDMAAYKVEVLDRSYKRRLRPRAHYSLGWLPRWARLASKAPRLANSAMRAPVLGALVMRLAGVDRRRSLPAFAHRTFREWFEAHPKANGTPVALWVDTFTEYFSPAVGIAAVRVLEHAGYSVVLTDKQTCCGLTWISTGQVGAARRILSQSLDLLAPFVDDGVPVVGLEPSCTSVFRSDARELLEDERVEKTAAAVVTLAELLARTVGWQAPDLSGVEAVAQPHCHHHATMGWQADEALLVMAGAAVKRVGGCCGLAGNFGVESGHYETSVAVAEHDLLPAVRNSPDATVLADGFSCRTQLQDLAAKDSKHLAELLAEALDRSS